MENKFRKFRDIGLIFFVFLSFTILTLFQPGLKIDESLHHYPLFQKFFDFDLIEIINSEFYEAANPPLPYLINLALHKLLFIEPGITTARIFTAFIGCLSAVLIYLIFLKFGNKYPLPSTLIIVLYPYFLKPAFTFYMAVYGLLFFLALWIIHEKVNRKPLLQILAGLLLTAAILSQQFYVTTLTAFLLFLLFKEIITDFHNKNLKGEVLKRILPALRSHYYFLFILFPILIFTLPLFLSWGGMTHPNYRFHTVAFDPTNITSILISAGGFLLPISIYHFKKITGIEIILFIFTAIFLIFFFYPEWTIKAGKGRITGMSFHFAELAQKTHFLIGYAVKLILLLSGLVILALTIRKIRTAQYLFGVFAVAFFFAGFLFNEFLAERHLLPLIVTLYLLHLNDIKNKKTLWIWAAAQGGIGLVYYYYYLFIQKNWNLQL